MGDVRNISIGVIANILFTLALFTYGYIQKEWTWLIENNYLLLFICLTQLGLIAALIYLFIKKVNDRTANFSQILKTIKSHRDYKSNNLLSTFECIIHALKEIDLKINQLYVHGEYKDDESRRIKLPIKRGDKPQDGISLEDKFEKIILRHLEKSPYHPDQCNIESDVNKGPSKPDSRHLWVIDALDGTRLLMGGFPLFTVSIALCEIGKNTEGGLDPSQIDPILGVIYCPVTKELFFAFRDMGSYLNNFSEQNRLKVNEASFENSFVHIQFPNVDLLNTRNVLHKDLFEKNCEIMKEIFSTVYRIQGLRLGSLSLAYLAKGTYDACIDFCDGTLFIDIAAGLLILKEAGGTTEPLIDHSGRIDEIPFVSGSPAIIKSFKDTISL